jgi:hypothetical protein
MSRLTAEALPKREQFNAARESLLGLRQTADRRERIVPMVRTAEDFVLGSACGETQGRIAFRLRVRG